MVRWWCKIRRYFAYLGEGHGANEKLKSTIRPGMEHPFPRVKVVLRTPKGIWLIRVLPKVSWRQLAIACPDINNYFTTDSSFRILLHFSGRPRAVRTWSPFAWPFNIPRVTIRLSFSFARRAKFVATFNGKPTRANNVNLRLFALCLCCMFSI